MRVPCALTPNICSDLIECGRCHQVTRHLLIISLGNYPQGTSMCPHDDSHCFSWLAYPVSGNHLIENVNAMSQKETMCVQRTRMNVNRSIFSQLVQLNSVFNRGAVAAAIYSFIYRPNTECTNTEYIKRSVRATSMPRAFRFYFRDSTGLLWFHIFTFAPKAARTRQSLLWALRNQNCPRNWLRLFFAKWFRRIHISGPPLASRDSGIHFRSFGHSTCYY